MRNNICSFIEDIAVQTDFLAIDGVDSLPSHSKHLSNDFDQPPWIPLLAPNAHPYLVFTPESLHTGGRCGSKGLSYGLLPVSMMAISVLYPPVAIIKKFMMITP